MIADADAPSTSADVFGDLRTVRVHSPNYQNAAIDNRNGTYRMPYTRIDHRPRRFCKETRACWVTDFHRRAHSLQSVRLLPLHYARHVPANSLRVRPPRSGQILNYRTQTKVGKHRNVN